MKTSDPYETLYPEIGAGGFSRVDGTVAFYSRVTALVTPNMRVLDLGAGRGAWFNDSCVYRRNLQLLRGRVARVVGCDVSDAVLENPSIDEAHVIKPGGYVPFPDGHFDLIVSDWTLEHIEDPTAYATEVARLLRPGGWFCARTPNRWHYTYLLSALIPNRLHKRILELVQPLRQEKDVFPTYYRLNTLRTIRKHFPAACFSNYSFHHTASPAYHFNNSSTAHAMAVVDRLLPQCLGQALHVFIRKLH